MPSGPLRRAQLIAPFGVGALVVVPSGTSLIAAGLDHWFKREEADPDSHDVDIDEYRVEEWRLQDLLKVNHFRQPPDFRKKRPGDEVPNLFLTVPFQRFPQWHFCWRCSLLVRLPLVARGRQKCPECDAKKKYSSLAQVPFVAMCEYGHLQDFPWNEWVHSDASPSCAGPIRLRATGGATLSAQKVECDRCQSSRTLAQITEAAPDGSETYLSSALARTKEPYLCRGFTPWHGTEDPTSCGHPLRGSLRSASNVYYAITRSAIYLPRATADFPEELEIALTTPPGSSLIGLLGQLGASIEPDTLREHQRALFEPFSNEEIRKAISALAGGRGSGGEGEEPDEEDDDEDDVQFRFDEYEVLRQPHTGSQLAIRRADLNKYESQLSSYFSRIMLVDQVRETRALVGFNRIYPESGTTLKDRKALLWRGSPDWKDSWLPAYMVFGEGIFFELQEAKLSEWEQGPEISQRLAPLHHRYGQMQAGRRLRTRDLSPRFVLIHTLAHVLMNQLTYECGYSSAALRERLYVSTRPGKEMAGILIYTAAGDAEGTMGGLVRMGKPGYLERTFSSALSNARWCSSDPVCMEIGRMGQGPDSCNLAACHNCGLVPETACEEFNRFLDRGVLVGSLDEPSLGYFVDLVTSPSGVGARSAERPVPARLPGNPSP